MTPSVSSLALGGLALAFASSLSAQTLAQYSFSGSSLAPATVNSGVTAGNFTKGPGIGGSTQFSVATGSPSSPSIFTTGTLINNEAGDWFSFTVTPTAGNVLNLSAISFAYAFSYTGGTAPTDAAVFEVRSSLDNYGSVVGSVSQSVPALNTYNWQVANFGLSAATYQSIGAITFRIMLSDGLNTNGSSQLRLDTVTLSGVSASPVPEPSAAAALVGLAGLGFAALRRRRVRPV